MREPPEHNSRRSASMAIRRGALKRYSAHGGPPERWIGFSSFFTIIPRVRADVYYLRGSENAGCLYT